MEYPQAAQITATADLGYKAGYVLCACGWREELGDGFNGYTIAQCPTCDPRLVVRNQRKVVYFDKARRSLRADIGANYYFVIFVISNGIHVRYKTHIDRVEYGTEKQLDRL